MSIHKLLQQTKYHCRIELPESFDREFLRPMRMGPCFLTSGGSILRPDGEFVIVSTSDFAKNIIAGKNCFLCGCYPGAIEFNNEHVIPDWLLRYTDISNMSIALPNDHFLRYSSYKVRSCVQCNSLLSKNVEDPISQAIKGGFENFTHFFEQNRKLVFQWLSLIYYKVHFRDFTLRYNVDRRHHDAPIGALYAWPNFHHIFSIARSVIFESGFSNHVIGTIRIFQLNEWERHGKYDYHDHWLTDTMFIRIKDICIYVSFSDAEAINHMMQNKFARVPERLNYIQSVEIFGDFVSAKLHFNQQHSFCSIYDADYDWLQIIASISDSFAWNDLDQRLRGSAQVFAFQKVFGHFTLAGLSHEETFKEIASGHVTFFPFEEAGDFRYVEHGPPDDPDHAKKMLFQMIEEETIRRAFDTLTKDYFESG